MPVDPRNFHRAFKERATKAGVPVTSVHATRRACASLLVALDVHPRVAMQILRHSQIAVTMDVYSQVSGASTVAALKRLGQELTGRPGDQRLIVGSTSAAAPPEARVRALQSRP